MGYIYVIISSVLFGIMPTIQEHVMTKGASPLGLVIICNSTAAVASLIAGLIRKESFRITKKQLLWLAMAGCIGLFLTDFLLNVAYTMIPVGFTTMIHFLFPSLVCVIMAIMFKDKFNFWKIGAIILSIIGLVLISGGDFSGNKWGILVAASTAFAYAFFMIANDKSPIESIPLQARSFYVNLFVGITATVVSFFTKNATFPEDGVNFAISLSVGVMLCIATVAMSAGIARLGAAKASFINMIEPVVSIIVSAIVFRYNLALIAIVGCVAILGSLFLITMSDKKAEDAARASEN